MLNKFSIAILALSSVSLLITPPAVILFLCGLVQAFFLPGLVFLMLFGDRKRSALDNLFLPPLISPILLPLLLLASYKVTGTLSASLNMSFSILYILLLVLIFLGRVRVSMSHSLVPTRIVLISLFFSGLILVSYLINGFLTIRSDAWYHASIVNEIMDRGIPPMEPAFPDVPNRYMWFYHLFLVIWCKLSGLSIFQALGFFNIVNAFVFPYLIARFISVFTNKVRYIVTAPLFGIAGLESASWVFWFTNIGRAFYGEVKGVEEIKRILSNVELNGAHVIDFLSPHWTWMVNLIDKFLTITAFSYSLNLFLLCFIFILSKDFHHRSPLKSLLNIFLVTIGCLLFHPITGMSLILTIVGSGILIVFTKRMKKRKIPLFQSVFVTVAAILAVLISFPYIAKLMGSDEEGNLIRDHLHLGFKNIFTIAAPLLILFHPTRSALKHIFTSKEDAFLTLRTWIVCLLLLNIFIDLPTVNESKFVFPLFLLLSPFIVRQIVDWLESSSALKRILLLTWIAVLFLVPPVLTFRGFILEKPTSMIEQRRYTITGEDRMLFDWIKSNTAPDAIVIENDNYGLIPMYAQRRNFYSPERVVDLLHYRTEKVKLYREIHERLYSDEPLLEGTIKSLRSVGQDVYIIVRKEDLESVPSLAGKFLDYPNYFVKVYDNAQITLYLLR